MPPTRLHARLIDRDEERLELTRLLERARPALILLTGRRRVGKTFLLSHAWNREQLFLFTAARTTPELNRRQLLQDFAEWRGEPVALDDFPTWRTVFRHLFDALSRRRKDRAAIRTALVLDEFQYLADGPEGLAVVASELNASWEEQLGNRRSNSQQPLLVALVGSAVATLEALASGGGPLHGRFDWQHKLEPLTYWYASELAEFRALRDRAAMYGIFGGTPRYLATIDTAQSLPENVQALLLSPRGEVRQLIETALDQEEGLRDASKYRAILRAVGDGCTERNEIAQRSGLANDHGLREKLGILIDLGYLELRRNIDAKANDSVRYAIADPAFRFYNRFVAPNLSALERYPPNQIWRDAIAPALDTYLAHEFERIVTQAYDRRAIDLGLPLVRQWGHWEGVDRARRAMEIDIVSPLVDGRMMTGSIKWDRTPAGARIHHDHMDMLERAADAGRAWAHAALKPDAPLYYVSAAGFRPAARQAAEKSGHPVILWSLQDIYVAPPRTRS